MCCVSALLFAAPSLAQEVPGTVTFKPVVPPPQEAAPPQKQEAPALPETPFRKPPVAEPPKEKSEKPEEPKPMRRRPALERKTVQPPEELSPPAEAKKAETLQPVPEGRKPIRLIDGSPVVFSEAKIALYTWHEREKYFEDDPSKIRVLRARMFRGEKVVIPDSLSKMPLPEDLAVLTIFPFDKIAQIPLAGQYFSLDLLFLDEEGVIREMVYRTEPRAEKTVISEFPARSVLQLKAGSIQAWGLKIGDKLAIPPR